MVNRAGSRKGFLTACMPPSILSRPDGRMVAALPFIEGRGEESPGSTETRCRVTPGGGDPRDSATESIPPACSHAGKGERVR